MTLPAAHRLSVLSNTVSLAVENRIGLICRHRHRNRHVEAPCGSAMGFGYLLATVARVRAVYGLTLSASRHDRLAVIRARYGVLLVRRAAPECTHEHRAKPVRECRGSCVPTAPPLPP